MKKQFRFIRRLLLAALFYAVSLGLLAQAFDYADAWKQIEELKKNRLPQSMSEKLDLLYQEAAKDGKTDQQLKAIIYELSAIEAYREPELRKGIEKAATYLETADFPASAIIHSMLGALYWNYYQRNRERFSQRSPSTLPTPTDLATWDLGAITRESIRQFKLSLIRKEELQNYLIADYRGILTVGEKVDLTLRPSLYDFLAHRALTFFQHGETSLTLPLDEFTISDSSFFLPAGLYARSTFSPADTLSLLAYSAQLYQELILSHLEDSDPSALVEVNLERLDYMYRICTLPEPEKLYEAALRMERERYSTHPVFAQFCYKLAVLYHRLGDRYQEKLGDDYRLHNNLALALCDEGYAAFPESFGGESCHNLAGFIRKQELELTVEDHTIPDKPFRVLIDCRNISAIKILLYQINYPQMDTVTGYHEHSAWITGRDKVHDLMKNEPLWSQDYYFEAEGDQRTKSYELPIAGVPCGHYIIIAHNIDRKDGRPYPRSYKFFDASQSSYLSRSRKDAALLVLDRESGQALKNVKLTARKMKRSAPGAPLKHELEWEEFSNSEGRIVIPGRGSSTGKNTYILLNGADTLFVAEYLRKDRWSKPNEVTYFMLYPDRAIYRPGQTIHLKGLIYRSDKQKHYELYSNNSFNLLFMNPKKTEISRHKVNTNDYGTFNLSLTAPEGALTGTYYIYALGTYQEIRIEQYKRPQFEVTIDKPTQSYKLNQELSVSGLAEAYAGFPIDHALVRYRVQRKAKYPFWYWWWGSQPPDTPQKEISQGSCITDAQGRFTLTFLPSGEAGLNPRQNPYFTFSISVDVTDQSGETHSAVLDLEIGDQDLLLDPEVPENVDLLTKHLTIPLNISNLHREAIAAQGTITICQLEAPDHIQKERLWPAPKRNQLSRQDFLKLFPTDIYGDEDDLSTWKTLQTVFSGQFDTAVMAEITLKDIQKWKPGAYRLEVRAHYQQSEVTAYKYFTVFNSSASTLPYPLASWIVPIKVICEPGESAELLIGSSYPHVSVLCEVENDYQILRSWRITLNGEYQRILIPVTETDRGGFYLHLSYVIDGRMYLHRQEISVPWSNKKLHFEYSTFRDKLLPGQKEEWRLKLKDWAGKAAQAEVLASMYDASLDAFTKSEWNSDYYGKLQPYYSWENKDFVKPSRPQDTWPFTWRYPARSHAMLNWYGFMWENYDLHLYDIPKDAVFCKSAIVPLEDELVLSDNLGSGAEKTLVEQLSSVQPRSNFAETAFYYPSLITDDKGELQFSFTVPESLTRWKFRALASGKDLQVGYTESFAVSQKPLMVQPNPPRFLREGDELVFSAKLSSLDAGEHTGFCSLQLFDALTSLPVDGLFGLNSKAQSFTVSKGQSSSLSWILKVPSGIPAVNYRILAKAGDFSDGEENTLPILSRRILVTESLPLPVPGNSRRDFVFTKLRESSKSAILHHHRLSLEYCSNPSWYALQSLPYLMESFDENNVQIFSRLYANSLAAHVANSQPAIKSVFEAWKNTPGSQALLSNLEKNQELKSIVLQETPWVLDSESEGLSKQRLGNLFDPELLGSRFDGDYAKLQQNQMSNGGWPWLPGMNDSWWVSQHILAGFGHLRKLGVRTQDSYSRKWEVMSRACTYLDRKIAALYEEIKATKPLENDNLDYLALHYLYTRSFFPDIPLNSKAIEAVAYFNQQADLYWMNKSIYAQSLIALARHRDGIKTTPEKIIASLNERASQDAELGLWWEEIRPGYFWYQAPIQTMALLAELYYEVASDTERVNGIKTWLLKNKQTNHWNSSTATAEAAYVLLLTEESWLPSQSLAEITWGGIELDPNSDLEGQVEAGTGYFKTAIGSAEITPRRAEISVRNPNPGPSWGGLYWQYFEDLDNITPTETPLKLRKQLFVERNSPRGPVLELITPKAKLKVGDKIVVRLELSTDRDLEYLHLKDLRGSGLEPLNVLSRTKRQDGICYYESTGDAATNFFIEYLRKGSYVFEYPLRVNIKGSYANGIASIQCMYAPEFTAHSEGFRIEAP